MLSPVGTYGGVVGYLVVVHPLLTLLNEADLLAVGPDARGTGNRLLEVCVDWRTCDGLESLQLSRCGHVESLWGEGKDYIVQSCDVYTHVVGNCGSDNF